MPLNLAHWWYPWDIPFFPKLKTRAHSDNSLDSQYRCLQCVGSFHQWCTEHKYLIRKDERFFFAIPLFHQLWGQLQNQKVHFPVWVHRSQFHYWCCWIFVSRSQQYWANSKKLWRNSPQGKGQELATPPPLALALSFLKINWKKEGLVGLEVSEIQYWILGCWKCNMKEPPIGVKSTNLSSQVNNKAFYTLKRKD